MSLWSDERVTIIGEIGSNHNGSLETAYALIDVIADAGADVAKFQSFLVDELLAADDPNYRALKRLELPREWYAPLKARCEARGLVFLSTATNNMTIDWMEALGVAGYKIASGNITHRPLIDRLLGIGKPLIISTGLSTLDEVIELEAYLRARGHRRHAFLHCVSKYPALPAEMRLGNIQVLRDRLSCAVGLSDHSKDVHMAVAAVALGARIVEKHVTLDGTGIGLDHEVALKADEFRELCRVVRETESALVSDFSPNLDGIYRFRRSLRASRDLRAGEVLARDMIKVTRPEDGLLPAQLPHLIGRQLAVDVPRDTALRFEHCLPGDED